MTENTHIPNRIINNCFFTIKKEKKKTISFMRDKGRSSAIIQKDWRYLCYMPTISLHENFSIDLLAH